MKEEPDNNKEIEESPFTILNIVLIFLKHRKQIIISTAIVVVISIILYFFVFDLIYTSTASIKSTTTTTGLLGGLDVGLPDIGSLDDFGIGTGKSAKELASYEEILKSRKCIEPLIDKFGLMERDDYRFKEDAIKDFIKDRLNINIERLAGIMYISVEDKDPVVAKEMVEFLIGELDKINIELSVQNAKSNREFIENRYFKAKEDLSNAEDSLKSFQMTYGVAPDLQIKAAAQSEFTLEAQLKTEEVKLDVLKKILSADQPEVKTQESTVGALKSKIEDINKSTNLNEFLRLGNSPQIAMQFLRLSRDVEIQTKILTFLLPLYEKAKIDEKRETPTIMVLDKPNVAERKTRPKRLTMVIVWTFMGFTLAIAYFAIKERVTIFIRKLRSKD